MTPWDRLRLRVGGKSEQHRRNVLLAVPLLIAIALLVVFSPWAIWPIATAAIWLVAIGLVVFAAVRLAMWDR